MTISGAALSRRRVLSLWLWLQYSTRPGPVQLPRNAKKPPGRAAGGLGSTGFIPKERLYCIQVLTIAAGLPLLVSHSGGFFHKRFDLRGCRRPRNIELSAYFVKGSVKLLPFRISLKIFMCCHLTNTSLQVHNKYFHCSFTGKLIARSSAKTWKRTCTIILHIVLCQLRNLCFKGNRSTARMVNRQLDTVGNQDPPYSMVFSGLSNNCRIALRLALNI